jgi:hypothetical protein
MKLPTGSTITLEQGEAGSTVLAVDTANALAAAMVVAPSGSLFGPGPVERMRRASRAEAAIESALPLGRSRPSVAVLETGGLVEVPRTTGQSTTVTAVNDTVVVARPSGARTATVLDELRGFSWGVPLTGEVMEEVLPVVVAKPGLNLLQIAATDGKEHTAHAATAFVVRPRP